VAGGTTTDHAAGGGAAGDATAGSQPGGGALGGGTAGAEEPTPATDVAAVAPAVESPDQDDGAESALSQAAPEASPLEESDDSSGGPSTLRVLQIVAAIAFVASLTAVFLPRVMGRQER
jgi:hypothetical protein